MHAFAKPALIGALVAACGWAVHGQRESQALTVEPELASAASTAPATDSRPSIGRWLVAEHVEPAPAVPLDAQPVAAPEPRADAQPPRAREGAAAQLREATTSAPSAAHAPPLPAAASIALPPGVTTQDVAISPAGMLAVMRRAPNATPPSDDGPGYGAAAAPGRPAAVPSQ